MAGCPNVALEAVLFNELDALISKSALFLHRQPSLVHCRRTVLGVLCPGHVVQVQQRLRGRARI